MGRPNADGCALDWRWVWRGIGVEHVAQEVSGPVWQSSTGGEDDGGVAVGIRAQVR